MTSGVTYLGSFLFACGLILTLSALGVVVQAMRGPRYPGPFLAKVTKWLLRWHEIRNTREKFIERLHKQYGPLVQIAPRQVSVNTADGIRDIFAVTRRLDRPEPLPILHLYRSENLVSTVSGELHQERRKPLRSVYAVRAIESEATQDLYRGLLKRLISLIDGKTREGGPVDAYRLSIWFGADNLSHMVFGSENSLNLLGDEDQRRDFEADLAWSYERLISFAGLMSFWYPNFVMWLKRTGFAPTCFAGEGPEGMVMDKIGREALQRALAQRGKGSTDQQETLMERIVSEFQKEGPSEAIPNTDYILSETMDHFWAGVTTTGDAFSAAFYQLSHPQNKAKQIRLRDELKKAGIESGSEVSLAKVKAVDYLDFMIRETLRHSMPIPFTMSRKVTAEAMDVLGHWISPGMEVGAQAYSVHRNLNAFSDPEEWSPERWEVENEPENFKCMKRHSFAFGAGPRMCIGMNVAMTELKLLIARVYSTYETKLSPEWFLENGELRDEEDREKLWPAKRYEPLLFRRLD